MTQTASPGDSQSSVEATRKDDLLERQLEKLFSDLTPPEPSRTSRQRSGPHTGTSQQPATFAAAGAPASAHKRFSLKLRWLTLARSLSALVPFMVLFSMVAERTGLAWPLYTATSPAMTPQAVVQDVLATDTLEAPSPSATPTAPTAIFKTQTPTAVRPTLTALPATHTPTLPPPTATTIPATATPTLTPTDAPATSTPILLPTAAPTATSTSEPQAPPTLTPVPTTEPAPAVPSPTRLLIPAINLEATIVKVGFVNYEIGGQRVSTWAVPERFAVGWHHNSALPGQIGNTVLNGHQNVYGRVFRDLNKLQAGDEIFVYVGENAHRYLVAEQHLLAEEGQPLEVRVENARWILPTQDERLTLVTCAPDTSSTHRLIVVAFPID